MDIIYPGVKRRDGKLTEIKLTLVEPDEFIGRKMPVSDKPREEVRGRGRKIYIAF